MLGKWGHWDMSPQASGLYHTPPLQTPLLPLAIAAPGDRMTPGHGHQHEQSLVGGTEDTMGFQILTQLVKLGHP